MVFKSIAVRRAQGAQTIPDPRQATPAGLRGKPVIGPTSCVAGCGACVAVCPTGIDIRHGAYEMYHPTAAGFVSTILEWLGECHGADIVDQLIKPYTVRLAVMVNSSRAF